MNGKICTREVREVLVENTSWPDYVFEQVYPLAELSAVADHIKTKGHLEGIPPASKVAKSGWTWG